jgi:class 3 adenylate cyclase
MIPCPNCLFENPGDSAFCENCGSPLAPKCYNCGGLLTANARFCKHCGAPQPQAKSARAQAAPARRESDSGWSGEAVRLAALHRSMPEPLAQKILSTRGHVEGERKQVTVLFTDIVDSTALAEQMDPEQWAAIVNGAHRLVTDRVYQYEGTVAQLLGDGVLCFFGAPISHEDDPERGVRAALTIVAGIREYAEELEQRFGVKDLRLRIGLNTGLVVVGNVGSSLHFEYLAIGDTVNLAARMQAEASPNSILMTENTHRFVSTLFEFRDRGELVVKGKTVPVHAYQAIGEKLGAPKRRGVAGLSSPMVGRDREFATLKQLTEELLDGKGAVVNVIGEAGIGKSRLLAEWRNWVSERTGEEAEAGGHNKIVGRTEDSGLRRQNSNVRWAEGRCLSYGVKGAYHLIVDLTRSILDVPSDLPDQEMRAALQRNLKQVFADNAALYDEAYPFLAHLLALGLAPEQSERLKSMDTTALEAMYATVIRRTFHTLAKLSPTIIVCEDMHWADSSSVELLGRLLPLATELPLLVCLVTRPDHDSPGWRLVKDSREMPGVGAIEMHLATLSEGETRKLVANLLREGFPSSVRDLILSKAEGNPFFVEEVIGILVDRGVMRRQDGGWIVTQEVRQIEIPETIQGVLMARVDQLPEEVKHTLQVASVIGREFTPDILVNVLRRQSRRATLE